MLRLFVVSIISAMLYCSCSGDNNINSAPEITYMGMNKDILIQGDLGLEDTLVVRFGFNDLDGDLSGVANNVEVIDNRNGQLHVVNRIPDLPQTDIGNVGTVILNIPTLCCLFDDEPACSTPEGATNSMTFGIRVFDQAGNVSNTVNTDEIVIQCL
jgi:hypothetical protein